MINGLVENATLSSAKFALFWVGFFFFLLFSLFFFFLLTVLPHNL